MILNNKKLSIIILNYNSHDLIKECLRSFERYAPKIDYEIIIANNDNNRKAFNDFSENYPEVKFIQNTGNWGFSSGCNLGASIATGEYFLFLNPDTQLTSSPAIDEIIKAMDNDSGIGICSCKIIDLSGDEKLLNWNNPWLFIGWIKAFHNYIFQDKIAKEFSENKSVWYPKMISGAALTISADDFRKIGGWASDKYWMYTEDRDISNRVIMKLHKKLVLLRNYSICHIWGGTSEDGDSLMLFMAMVVSRHNYINHSTSGVSRLLLLSLFILKSFTIPIIKLFLNILLFRRGQIYKYRYIVIETIQFYLKSIKRRTWASDKLEPKVD